MYHPMAARRVTALGVWFLLLVSLPGIGAPPLNQVDEEDLNLPVVRGVVRVSVNDTTVKDYRGSAVARTSDLDGDGITDMVVGAYADDTTATDAGAFYIFYLQHNVNKPVRSFSKVTSGRGGFATRLQASDYFGVSLAGLPDVDGDGVGDVVVGALGDDDVALNAGAVYMLFMSRDTVTPVQNSVKITTGRGGFDAPLGQNSYFGSALGMLHDVDGNGVADLAVGAYGEDKLAGAVYILFLQRSTVNPVMGYWKLRSRSDGFPFSLLPGNAFGVAISSIADMNDDGVPEMVVGAYMDGEHTAQSGAVYVVMLRKPSVSLLGADVSPVLDAVKINVGRRGFNDTSLTEKAYFGASLAGFSDLDNDGLPELVVGTIGDNKANANAGALHMLYLGLNETDRLPYVRRWRKITTNSGEGFNVALQVNQNFGAAVAELPDLDGDNVTELVVGSYVATNASTFVLYKNLLAPLTEAPPKIYSVQPALLSPAGGEGVTLYAAVDVTNVNISEPFNVRVTLGLFACADPVMQEYEGKAFPGLIGSSKQEPFVISCVSSVGVGGGLMAQAVIEQHGAEVTLSMPRAVGYSPPVVTAVRATGSAARGGFDVMVSGQFFGVKDFKPTVFIHGSPCNVSVWQGDSAMLCIRAPAGLGEASVQVSVGGQISGASPAAVLGYDGPMLSDWRIHEPQAVSEPILGTDVVTSSIFSPYTAGEELLQLFGANFGPSDNDVEVFVGQQPCARPQILSDYEITCVTPPGTGAGHVISVVIAGRYRATMGGFAYGIPLVVTVVPEIANLEGGDMVIMGRNFGAFASSPVVMIGDVACRDVKVVFEHELLTCKYPPGTGKELQLTVEVVGQRNDPPRAYSYADIFGMRTVEVDFLLGGESVASFGGDKRRRFETILQSVMDQDPTVAVLDDGVHVLRVLPHDDRKRLETLPDFRSFLVSGAPVVRVRTDVATQNAKTAETMGTWLRNADHVARFQTYLKTASINALGLHVLSTNVSETIYCPPGQQPQEIAPREFTCVPCPVGFYQPLRSKETCPPCPIGAVCNNTGIQMPSVLAGFWRQVGNDEASKTLDPYFHDYHIYPCNPPTVCLGGVSSWCSEGHVQGSPLCAVCEPGYYLVNGYCTLCGNKRSIQVTLYLILAMAIAIFFGLLYAFVRPGNDIDEATEAIKDQVGEGPGARAFNPSVTMRSFLDNTLSRHLSTKLTRLTHVPDLWSKAKISITFLQIMASLNVAYTIPWPGHFRRVLERLYVINLNVLSMPGLAYSCVAHVNYFDEFHVAIIFPFVLTLFFLLVHHVGMTVIHRKVQANATVISSLEDQVCDLRAQLVRKMRAITASMRTVKRHNSSTLPPMQRLASADESLTLLSRPSTHQTSPPVSASAGPTHSPPDNNENDNENENENDDDNATSPPVFGFSHTNTTTTAEHPSRSASTSNGSISSSSLLLPRPFSPPAPSQSQSPEPPMGREPLNLALGANRGKLPSPLPLLPEDRIALPSPQAPPCAIDIFSPLHPPSQSQRSSSSSLCLSLGHEQEQGQQEGQHENENDVAHDDVAHDDVALDIPATPSTDHSSRGTVSSNLSTVSTVSTVSTASSSSKGASGATGPLLGDGPRASSSSTSSSSSTPSLPGTSNSNSDLNLNAAAGPPGGGEAVGGGGGRRMIKHATFSLNAGEGGSSSRSSLRPPSEGSAVSKSAGSGVLGRLGGDTVAGGLAALGKDLDDEESIMELKHKVAILEKQQNFEQFSKESFTSRLLTFWFWIILLIYPSVSRVVLEAVNCRTLDGGRRYLVSDFTIDCDSLRYKRYLPAFGLALLLYPFGIPVMFFLLLKFRRNTHPWDDNLSFLYKAYRPNYWWFEVYELVRKLFLTGLIIFVAAGTATQIAIACVICVVTTALHLRLQPYEDRWDDILQTCSLGELLIMTYCALLLKLDLTGADSVSVAVFDYVLLASNAFVLLFIMPTSFYIQSKQYIDRFLRPSEQTLPTLMKREAMLRGATSAALFLALWASMANSKRDAMDGPVTGLAILMLCQSVAVGLYFLPFLQGHLPTRFRILPCLDPSHFSLESDQEASARLGALRVSQRSRESANLAKLNTRKVEAMKAAGLLRAPSNTSSMHRGDSLGERQASVGHATGAPDGAGHYVRRQGSTGQQSSGHVSGDVSPRALLGSSGYSGSLRAEHTRLGLGHRPSVDEEARLPLFSGYALWVRLVRHRRIADPVCAVLMFDLAVMCGDRGHGSTNAARIVMLGMACLFTIIISVFPQVHDGRPPVVSPLRVCQCALSLSTLSVLFLSFHTQLGGPSLPPPPESANSTRPITLSLLSLSAAVLSSALCLLHSSLGIVRRLASWGPLNFAPPPATTSTSTSHAGTRGSSGKQASSSSSSSSSSQVSSQADLRRLDSAYATAENGPRRLRRDLLLLLLLLLSALGLGLSRPTHGGQESHVTALVMVVGLGLLFSYRPIKALREANDEFLTQLALVRLLVLGLRRPRGREKEGALDDVFDERDLSRTTSPEVLAAEVIRLRRRIAEMEERSEVEAQEMGRSRAGSTVNSMAAAV